MGSSDIADSGRFPASGQKSNFNQTCSLLSQYLKEKGTLGDLNLRFNRSFETNDTPTKTMNLLPMIEKAGQVEEIQQVVKPEPEKAQLTIFYAGQVIVFNDFPADKAEEVMLLASKGSPFASSNHSILPISQVESANNMVTPVAAPIAVPSCGMNVVQENNSQRNLVTKINDLPIARKNSLTRFLEKRKDRIIAKAPYMTSSNKGTATSKPADGSKTWLGLGAAAQSPLQMNRGV